jgi:ABC-type sulfate transport system substrate-binding protein
MAQRPYDVTRELKKHIDTAVIADYEQKSRKTASRRQSHGASSAQALSVMQTPVALVKGCGHARARAVKRRRISTI